MRLRQRPPESMDTTEVVGGGGGREGETDRQTDREKGGRDRRRKGTRKGGRGEGGDIARGRERKRKRSGERERERGGGWLGEREGGKREGRQTNRDRDHRSQWTRLWSAQGLLQKSRCGSPSHATSVTGAHCCGTNPPPCRAIDLTPLLRVTLSRLSFHAHLLPLIGRP